MAIVKYKNQSGITYAYESISQWDPEKKQARPIRKYLGRVDPDTGAIIPTAGKRGRPPKAGGQAPSGQNAQIPCENCPFGSGVPRQEMLRLQEENAVLSSRIAELEQIIARIHRETDLPAQGH